ncbi:hypothetical protein KR009_008459, partial [Drosophila setifemur]
QGTNYEVIGDERTMNLVCDDHDNQGNLPLRQMLDISDLHFDIAEDMETLYYSGNIKVLTDVPRGPITMDLDLFRWERSQWLPLSVSMKRNNFCLALKDPREIWFPIVNNIPKNQRQCPPKKGHIFTLTNFTNHIFVNNMPNVDIVGDLKAVVHIGAGGQKTCAVVYFKVYAK